MKKFFLRFFGWIIDVAFNWWSQTTTTLKGRWFQLKVLSSLLHYGILYNLSLALNGKIFFVRNFNCCGLGNDGEKFPSLRDWNTTMELKLTNLWVMINERGLSSAQDKSLSRHCSIVDVTENYQKQTIFMMFLFSRISNLSNLKIRQGRSNEKRGFVCAFAKLLFIVHYLHSPFTRLSLLS